MNISLKDLIGKYVYKNNDEEPRGRVKGVCFADEGNRISSVTVESLSLIPLSTSVAINELLDTGNKKLILQTEMHTEKDKNGLGDNRVSCVVYKDSKYGKIKDMRFDFETGEITDMVIGKGAFRRGKKITVNKMHIKDNTIYIE